MAAPAEAVAVPLGAARRRRRRRVRRATRAPWRCSRTPIVPTLARLAAPNVLVMLFQSSVGLIEAYFVGQLGTDALAGVTLVFPALMLMQMMSAGAMGGGIASAVARALGAGRREDADALALHALAIALVFGVGLHGRWCWAFGRPLYAAMGGSGASLAAALAYSNVVFAGAVLIVALQFARRRDPRHRQHADAGERDLRRRACSWCRCRPASSSASGRCRGSASWAAASPSSPITRRAAPSSWPISCRAAASCASASRQGCAGRSSATSCASGSSRR